MDTLLREPHRVRADLDLFAELPAAAQPVPSQQRPAPPPPAPASNAAGPLSLHPDLWRAHQLGRAHHATWASGFAELDAQLPGGGWPAHALTELLLPHPGVGELRLLAPVLAALQAEQRCLMWFDPPALPNAWTLQRWGLDLQRLVLVRARSPLPSGTALKPGTRRPLPAADILWALEQALKSGRVGAVLAWLPLRLPADALRRLQLAAQAHEGPVFVLRDLREAQRTSPAPLRLELGCAAPDVLRLKLLKRRGPPLLQPLQLALPPVLDSPVQQRLQARAALT